MGDVKCEDCAFWFYKRKRADLSREDPGHQIFFFEGECRIHAPLPLMPFTPADYTPRVLGGWPETESTDSCGDFKRKEQGR